MNKALFIGMAVAALLAAQEISTDQKTPAPPHQKRVFQVKYADVRDLEHVLGIFGYPMKANPDLHVLAVSAPPDAMNAIEDAIKRLDVPPAAPKDIDLTAYLVVASDQPDGSAPLPPDLQAVTRELKGIFAYKSFHLLDTILLRTQTGNSAHANGVIAGALAENSKTPYEFSARPALVTEDTAGRLIRLDLLSLSLHLPGGSERAGISTEITVREGQKVVVGKSNMGAPGQALILVVTARVAG